MRSLASQAATFVWSTSVCADRTHPGDQQPPNRHDRGGHPGPRETGRRPALTCLSTSTIAQELRRNSIKVTCCEKESPAPPSGGGSGGFSRFESDLVSEVL